MFLRFLFPKLYFGIDDQNGGGGAPAGQPEPVDHGNDPDPNPDPAPVSEDVEFEGGVKISKDIFEKTARERFKDAFEAQSNRDKWQAENTKKAQENAQALRDAESYRRLMADPRYQRSQQPQDAREAYVAKKMKQFPEVDPRFFEGQFDDIQEFSSVKAKEALDPLLERQGQEYERKFLAEHPKVVKGTPQYQEILELTQSGVDPEKAYRIVFFDDLLKEKQDEAIKRRDEEAKRKLQQSRTPSTVGSKTAPKNFREGFDKVWDQLGYK